MRKLFLWFSIILIALPLNFISGTSTALGAETKLPPGKYSANNILAHDFSIHPTDFEITPGNIGPCSGADKVLKAKTEPEVYTELKNNTVHQEKWEAMAGVPTTETLFYSVGGSEYMVQVELTSRKGNHVRRDYSYNLLIVPPYI